MSADFGFRIRAVEERYINIQPIQRGGVLTAAARKALQVYGDGYSTCDFCLKPFRLDFIKIPPINVFYSELAEFLNMDVARVVPGARRGFQIVAHALLKPGDVVLVSSLGHYSIFLAIEEVGGIPAEIPTDEEYVLSPEAMENRIREIKEKFGQDQPKLAMISHVDYMFGNLHPINELVKVAKDYDIPFLYNGAYTVGIMPVDGKKLNVDFIVGSGHKSMASPAPTGVLATTEEWADIVFKTSKISGDLTGRKFGIKEVHLLGCTVMGAPLLGMMASFPYVKERVKRWDEELKKARYFAEEFEKIKGSKVLGQRPRQHTLMKVDTTESFDKVAKTHKKKGYFLYKELEKRGIVGIFPGATRQFKLNVYGLTWEQLKYVSDAFKEIAEKYGLDVEH
ncbi:MAG: O-phospho-L-seryl-tRNA:Cys-tRNA synthase [Candidatus Odinarchaeia archaeon]